MPVRAHLASSRSGNMDAMDIVNPSHGVLFVWVAANSIE